MIAAGLTRSADRRGARPIARARQPIAGAPRHHAGLTGHRRRRRAGIADAVARASAAPPPPGPPRPGRPRCVAPAVAPPSPLRRPCVAPATYDPSMGLRVAMIAAECEPWAKTGGLGDVVDALSRSLGRLQDDIDGPVDVFLPRYRSVPVPAGAGPGRRVLVPDPLAPDGATEVRIV